MPNPRGRPPLVSRGSFYSLSLDPLAKAQLQDAVAFIADKLDMRVSNSAVIRRAMHHYAARIAELQDAPDGALELFRESHLLSRAIRGAQPSGNTTALKEQQR
jgi:hypothetical protein